ncbi:ABC transporter permease [Sneathiella sp.]|uniref:ABC transporter permease n=1 Tax=Sneathiella sp. TaxID=1964365 RepID=UPI0026089CB5|nr:ABC transporter permease [Sneathiella sp.]MDF2366229.1 ABC transporter permease [Sneathiella sp.]
MVKSLSKRIGNAVILLLAVLVLNFTLIHIAPGDPVEVLAGEMGGATPELLAELHADFGLDQPFHIQLFTYLGNVLHGNLGHSFYYDKPVTELILDRMGATLLLVITALLFALLVGTALGVASAQKRNSLLSNLVTILSLAGFSAPVFWIGIMLILLLSVAVPIFPIAGMATADEPEGTFAYIFDVAQHLVLPVLTLASIYLAFYSRLSRASMLEVLESDYIRTARAKGLSRFLVVYKHALRNAVLPVVTFAGLQFAQVISGAVLVETVFAWPGLGTLAFESILRRDSPTLLGILFFSAVLVLIVNIVVDIAYRVIDPRISAK